MNITLGASIGLALRLPSLVKKKIFNTYEK